MTGMGMVGGEVCEGADYAACAGQEPAAPGGAGEGGVGRAKEMGGWTMTNGEGNGRGAGL